ncbi:MAG: translocation/assembly module TamB domain-containing protein, partial [Sulfurimonas sp.]|nr:translocation/assembly module TamB domain-containing protein [Sulfurimonas sp.]
LVFDAEASKVYYRTHLNVKKLAVKLSTSYGDAKIEGKIKANRLYANSSITPEKNLSKKNLDFLHGLGDTFIVDIDASLQKIVLKTRVDKLSLKSDQNLSLNNVDINLNYFIADNYFSLDTSYLLSYESFISKVEQKAIFTTDGVYSSDLNATLTKQAFELPFKSIRVEVSGNTENMIGKIYAGPLQFDLLSKDYKQFLIQANGKELELFKKNIMTLKADAILDISAFSLSGRFNTEGLNSTIEGDFELNSNGRLYQATLLPKPNSELFKAYKMELFSPLRFIYYDSDERGVLNLDAKMLNLTLFKKETALSGWGNIGSAYFTADGNIENGKETNIKLSAKIASIKSFLSEFGLKFQDEKIFFDGEVDINATLFLSDKMKLKSRINLPWYIIKTDTQTSYTGENFYIESTVMDKEITVEQYSFNILNHHIYSKRPSKISFDNNATLIFKEFWIYDNLLLTGMINPLQMQGDLRIQSDRFVYNGAEGNVTVKTDIKVDLQSDGTQNIEGTITLIDGVITYEPVNDHSISDDIIIIQDIKPRKESKRSVNIYVNALKPVVYKTKDVDIRIIPDIVIWQEYSSHIGFLGILSIVDGTVTSSEKVFEFEKSEIYFNGSNPINPYLNLNLHYHTLDYIDIEIFVSNTLGSPVIILSSKPAMSQNDIMSYILFGEPATSAFSNSGGGSSSAAGSLLLATGLKQIFNDTASVNIDTLNILTNEEGTLGYEIGTRFSKEIRMIYKSDTISSVILQYSLSKSIRIDVDVHETGQGVNIFYIKDF